MEEFIDAEEKIPTIIIKRPAYSQINFDRTHCELASLLVEENSNFKKKSCCSIVANHTRACLPTSAKSFLFNLFPFIKTLKNYHWRKDITGEIIAGTTVAFLHIPQAMADGQLATLTPANGLYVAFFPALFYFLMGTSRQLSVGAAAVVSMMIATFLDAEIYGKGGYNMTVPVNATGEQVAEAEMNVRIGIALSYNIIIGIYQLILGVLGAGFITDYLNDPFVSGYTTACAFHVFVSQIWRLFGIKGHGRVGSFKMFLTLYDLVVRISEVNWITLAMSCVTYVILVVWKEVFDPKVRKRFIIPIPTELILIVIADVISYFVGLHENHHVAIVGHIPRGFPGLPTVPPYFRWNYLIDAIPVALVSYSMCISMSKMLATKFHYHIRPSQEFLALGITNICCSFLNCFTASTAMSRTMVQANVGGKTQLASLISCCVNLVFILFLGSFLSPLPSCVLAAIVVSNLNGMFAQFRHIKRYWQLCKLDCVSFNSFHQISI